MTREQAINYLISRGLTQEQVGDVVRALTYKPRDCANCTHYVVKDTRTNWGSQETTKIYGCECWECEYEPTTKNDLGVDCISRDEVCRYVAEFVNHEFSTREEELIDNIITGIEHMPSVTPQEPKTGHWILAMPGGAEEWAYKCSECNFYKFKKNINLRKFKYCPNCGADMRGRK